MVGNTRKKKVRKQSSKLKEKNVKPGGSTSNGANKKVDLPKFLKDFDELLNKKDFSTPQKMLDSLRGIKKWQRLNLQSVIEYKREREDLAENLMRQALREDDVKPSFISLTLLL